MSGPVAFDLRLGGAPASDRVMAAVRQVEVEDNADLADMVRLRLATEVSPQDQRWSVLDEDVFTRLASIHVTCHVGSHTEHLIDAFVIDVRADLSNQPGTPEIEVIGMDASVLMRLEEKVRAWPNQADSSIASQIFSEYKLDPDVSDSQPARHETEVTTIQRGTDMEFLRALAERNGYELYLDLDDQGREQGHFHPPRLEQQPQTILSLNLGSETNVDNFRARYDMLRATTAAVTGLDVSSGESQPAQADDIAMRRLGAASAVASVRPRKVLLSGTGLAQSGELQTLAQAVVDRSSWAIVAEGTTSAAAIDRVLKAKQPVLVRGAGMLFSGMYYVERVLHVFSGDGYMQHFRLRRNAAGVATGDRFQQDDSAGPQRARTV